MFFVKQKTAYDMRISDWSSDVCSSDLAKPITAEELQRVTEGTIRELPNQFETNAAVQAGIRKNELLGRPEDYYQTLAAKFRSIGSGAISAAANQYLRPAGMTFVVVGDRKIVEPQLKAIGLPVEVRAAPSIDTDAEGEQQ